MSGQNYAILQIDYKGAARRTKNWLHGTIRIEDERKKRNALHYLMEFFNGIFDR